MTWLETEFLGNTVLLWLCACATALAVYLILRVALRFVGQRSASTAGQTETHVDDLLAQMLSRTRQWTLIAVSLLLASRLLELPGRWETRVDYLWFLVIGIQIGLWLNQAISYWVERRLSQKQGSAGNPVITTILSWILRLFLWTLVVLAVLANMGVNITAMVASLGIGGVAVALAVQNILGDLFASAAIGLDKPFEIGDFIVFGDVAGTVEHVGLKTTRIRALSGEQIVCSNTQLLTNTIHNYKRMAQRRIQFGFSIAQTTTAEDLEQIPTIVREAVEATGNARFDRAHFKEFGESALNFEVVYFVTSPDYNVYMDVQQAVNLTLKQRLDALQIELGVPVRRLGAPAVEAFLQRQNDPRPQAQSERGWSHARTAQAR
jgi:small-conductance mechanosensitive channel